MIILTMETVIDFLKDNMKKRNWSQADLARKSGLDTSLVSNILSGRRNIGVTSANAIAKAFKIPPEIIFRKAGLLPEVLDSSERLEELIYLYNLMPEEYQKDLIDYAHVRIGMLEREGKLKDE